jgi:hypothetical protein
MTDYDDISWNDYKLVYIKRFIKPIYKKVFCYGSSFIIK